MLNFIRKHIPNVSNKVGTFDNVETQKRAPKPAWQIRLVDVAQEHYRTRSQTQALITVTITKNQRKEFGVVKVVNNYHFGIKANGSLGFFKD